MTTSMDTATPLALVLELVDTARAQLSRYAVGADEPRHGTVEAVDLLDAVHQVLRDVSP